MLRPRGTGQKPDLRGRNRVALGRLAGFDERMQAHGRERYSVSLGAATASTFRAGGSVAVPKLREC